MYQGASGVAVAAGVGVSSIGGVSAGVGVSVVLFVDVGGNDVLVGLGKGMSGVFDGSGVSVAVGGSGVSVAVGGSGAVAVGIGAVGVGRRGALVGVAVSFLVETGGDVAVLSASFVRKKSPGACVTWTRGVTEGVGITDSGVVGWPPGATVVVCPTCGVTVTPIAVTSTVPSTTLTSVTPCSLTLTENSVPNATIDAAGV